MSNPGDTVTATTLRERVMEGIAGLPPAYFAMVMATGIVSIAAEQLQMHGLAVGLFALNILIYVILSVLTVARAFVARQELLNDLLSHQKAPGFFTMVAASCIMASQLSIIAGNHFIALLLWLLAMLLWLGFTYTIFSAFTVKETKPTLDKGISGAWLLAVVATQALAVAGAILAPHLDPSYRPGLDFLVLSLWLAGGMLYIWMISLIFYRYTFFTFSPADLTPPYWINMGAMAISTLAGARLIANAPGSPLLESLLPFIKGFTVLYWATGTWWIPMLLILGVWRHLHKRFPLRYDPLYWGLVFPLGMYTVCTLQMSKAMDLHFLDSFPPFFFAVALAAWSIVFTGLLRQLGRGLKRS
jgi:tellurite resistance protein TehA-like permease